MPKTIKKGTIEYTIYDAPESPLNLQLSRIYAPRKRDSFGGGFDGYSCVEVERGWFVVAGWGHGRTATIYEGDNLLQAYHQLATMLGLS